MKAVIFPEAGRVSVENVAEPGCGPDEVVVQVAACGICGTDLHIYRNEYMSTFTLIPGHEFGGRVVEVGRAVTSLAVGDRVAVDPNLNCGECDFCRNEQSNHCLRWQGVGVTRPGGFAEYAAVPARACYLVPERLTDSQMAFIEPLACVVYALRRVRIGPGSQALIWGAGPMGLLLVQALRHGGVAQVVTIERQPQRLALAASLGAMTVDGCTDPDEALRTMAPHGFDLVVDATGVPAVIEQALAYLKPRGHYLQFGVAPMDATVRIRPYDLFRYDWTLAGSFALCYTFQPAIAWLANGVIDVSALVSHRAPLEEFAAAFDQFARGETLKVHIHTGGAA